MAAFNIFVLFLLLGSSLGFDLDLYDLVEDPDTPVCYARASCSSGSIANFYGGVTARRECNQKCQEDFNCAFFVLSQEDALCLIYSG